MNHASLFSGIGGAEVAASMMGWRNLFHCEKQEFPRKVLQYWFPKAESYEDITKTNFSKWGGKIDVLTGGFPCQPFSIAGKRMGKDDDRYLWPEMLRAIREIQPSWVVCENVAGIRTMVEQVEVTEMGRTDDLFEPGHLYREEGRFTLERICRDIEDAGYSVQAFNIPACGVGAPHRRERIWIVAHRADARTETLQQGGKDGVLPDRVSANPHGTRHGFWKNQQEPKPQCCGTANLGTRRKKRFATCKERRRIKYRKDFWQNFPTQSPVCGGDDGLPFDVDDLAISFPRWRKESIRAYGNAWVPQVAYEIFKAIAEQEGL